ncbi:MAG: hypothetical protein WDM96_04850 [Lacunisphaera sp.]
MRDSVALPSGVTMAEPFWRKLILPVTRLASCGMHRRFALDDGELAGRHELADLALKALRCLVLIRHSLAIAAAEAGTYLRWDR